VLRSFKEGTPFYNRVGFKTSNKYNIYPTSGYQMEEPRCMMCQETYPESKSLITLAPLIYLLIERKKWGRSWSENSDLTAHEIKIFKRGILI